MRAYDYGAGCGYGVEWVVCVFDPMSWSLKEDKPR